METSGTLCPKDLDVSGSVEKALTMPELGITFILGQSNVLPLPEFDVPLPVLRIDRVIHARVRESSSMLLLVLIPRDCPFELGNTPIGNLKLSRGKTET